ncbi:MAG TPA: hypothetical protein VM305_11900 [Candidatus Limnocylindrales bacterium]|nr:hypothetical protein [Candidatus Limnocylindrales bacterium]
MVKGSGTRDDPWQLQTPPRTSEYTMYRDDDVDPPLIVCQVGSTRLTYLARAIEDLHAMLSAHGDWMDLGGADEQKEAKPGTVEAWARSSDNPVGGWYGQRKGYRGRFRGVHAAADGSARPGRGYARGEGQPDAHHRGIRPRVARHGAAPRTRPQPAAIVGAMIGPAVTAQR